MSRNLTSSRCLCGYWDFPRERELAQADSGLMTESAYFAAIGGSPYRGCGYGYRDDLDGQTFTRTLPFGEHSATYHSIPQEKRLRWRRLDCRICGRVYAGWYRAAPCRNTEPWKYELYDLSFFYAFNDEPSPRDVAKLNEPSPEDVALARAAWSARIGARSRRGP